SESAKLVASLLQDDAPPPVLRDRIVDKAEGNPLFIEEIVRSLIDEGLLYRDPSSNEWRSGADVEAMNVPRTIQGIIMARVDLLDTRLRALVRVASVVGRRFLYRVLHAVVQSAPELDEQLATLGRVGLILEDTGRSEPAYMFNHDLVHEAIYESIDDSERKELHARVGSAVERLFVDRHEEFLGLLAYHYSRAEMWEKAQEYLFKAGEDASRSAASDEALYYYQEALGIYHMLRGEKADPETVAMFEKNIGFAFFNRGYYDEAIEHMDKALNHYWGELPRNGFSTALRFLSSLAKLLLAVYFPTFWFKKAPTPRDLVIADLFFKEAEVLVLRDPKRFLIEFSLFYGAMVHLDLTKFKLGMAIFAGASPLFTFGGLSLGIGRKILDYSRPRLNRNNADRWIIYDLVDTQHHFLNGRWNEIAGYDEELVNRNLTLGETYFAAQHCYWHGLPTIYQGDFDSARLVVSKLSEIAEAYDNDIYFLLKYFLNIHLLIARSHIDDANAEINRGMDLVRRRRWGLSIFDMYALKASTSLCAGQTEKAGNSLDEATRAKAGATAAPMQLAIFYRNQFAYFLRRLEEALGTGERGEASEYRRSALKSGTRLIKTCRKAALYRTDCFRLMGVYNWLIDDRKSALEWWHKAIKEGESLGARPELARTYAEVGMRLHPTDGVSSGLDAKRAEDLLRKAETMFRDMSLHHDLEALRSAPYRTGRDPAHI
ncbi:MAG: hypothetical protein AB1664_00300, partial [Thermodesulfobacteriota bacterium]